MSSLDDILRPKPPPPAVDPRILSLLQPSPLPSPSARSILEQFLKPQQDPLTPNLGALNWPPLSGVPSAPAVIRRKVFISFHHANDEAWKVYFEKKLGSAMDGFISKAVSDGDIDPWLATDTIRDKVRDEFIRDATVTIVLIGTQTWQRRHVDWEISASLRTTKKHNRCGLLGILLPTHPSFTKPRYDGGLVPPRLVDNDACGYAAIYDWTENVGSLRAWIEDAFTRRTTKEPDNSYPSFEKNKVADRWK